MLRSVKSIEGLSIKASDGLIGKATDFYFDDEAWVVRFLVVNTSKWLGDREVLISPYAVGPPDFAAQVLPVTVTKEQVKNSPGIDRDKPISRQYEKSYLGYYGYPFYWGSTGLWGEKNYPGTLLTGTDAESYGGYTGYLRAPTPREDATDPHLRSCNAVTGYHIKARDGEIGHVQGFLVDDYMWSIRYLIVNTSNWWTGHKVLISPEWIQEVSWLKSEVSIDLDREAIRESPLYVEDTPLERESEGALYRHYGRSSYWREPPEQAAA
jgi:hypothetical protein